LTNTTIRERTDGGRFLRNYPHDPRELLAKILAQYPDRQKCFQLYQAGSPALADALAKRASSQYVDGQRHDDKHALANINIIGCAATRSRFPPPR
jgi:hypothetical protein